MYLCFSENCVASVVMVNKMKSNSVTCDIPKGKPKSGRLWKSNKTRFSSMKKDKPFRTTWARKLTLRKELKLVKDQDKAIKEAKKQEIEEKKKRRAENLRRREENAKKAEVVQKIKNSAKLKRMSKKQLRSIQKR